MAPSLPAGAAASPSGKQAKLTAVEAVSRHRLLVTYDSSLDAAALDASTYAFATSSGVNLPVLAGSQAASNQALLSTGPQEQVTYTVTRPRTKPAVTFTGSLDSEPTLQNTEALSNEQVLLTFSEPVGAGADQASSYLITVQGTTRTLAVSAAATSGDPAQVLLTTAPQESSTYVVTVGDIKGASGEYLDPTANTGGFAGLPPQTRLLSATPEGDNRLVLSFDRALEQASAGDPANYTSTPNLSIGAAAVQNGGKEVVLSTGTQYQVEYTVVADVIGVAGDRIDPHENSASFTGTRPISAERPKVVSAASTGNKTVVVQFSKPMADNTPDPSHFVIVQTNVNPEVGTVGITGAEWADTNHLSVRLATMSQAEVTYQVTANNVVDVLGNPLADRTNVGGVLVDPTSFTFPGTPPTGDERVDTDEDGVWDHEETRGYVVTILLANGETTTRQVTSSPLTNHTDDDGLTDDVERALNIDPRDGDTDDDGLGDYPEFNEFFSDPTRQDSDGDGLYDGLEATFFFTSPLFDDTDGDQLKDANEINVNRNPKVADLPAPVLRVGEMNMNLDVRFTETRGTTTRELDAKTVEATLVQSESQEFSTSEAATHGVSARIASTAGAEFTVENNFLLFPEFTAKVSLEVTGEVGTSHTWTSEFTESSSQATERAHIDSRTTEKEVAADASVTRTVNGATMKLGVFLESAGNVAFTVRNLQVAALVADPRDPSRLTPVATLLADSEPASGFSLGPLVPPKGPIVFSNSDIFPQLVDDLMRNPRGLVFRFVNYDIVDEAGRNFAFTSQEVNDRTARVAIDYGGFDPDGDGIGDDTEILRVATGIIGRRVVDTNGDGVIDDSDRRVVFDTEGKQVGISLRDALRAAGLKEYDEAVTPSSSLSPAQKHNSYSILKSPDGADERLFRVRARQIQVDSPRSWEILNSTGIDRSLSLDEHILYPGGSITLSYLEDLDQDEMPAVMEAMHNCTDSPVKDPDGKFTYRDTDGDGLDDRFEVLVGWQVDLHGRGVRDVHSRCSLPDTDGDGLSDRSEAPGIINYNAAGLVLFDRGVDPWVQANAPRRDTSAPVDPILGWALTDPITDPTTKDTDVDGLIDSFELTPYANSDSHPLQQTSPEHADSDRDTVPDGVERNLGGNPRVDDFAAVWDSDGDGLTDAQESDGWDVVVTQSHPRLSFKVAGDGPDLAAVCKNGACPAQTVSPPRTVQSDPANPDSDRDGLSDGEEFDLGADPSSADTDGDGLADFDEVRGFTLRDLGLIRTNPINVDTDNDRRSDGEEAGRVGPAVVVRIPGEAPYQVFTHPLSPDADLDLLVDGDEQAVGGDPAHFNTDEDTLSDYSEVLAFRRVDVPDLYVTLTYGTLSVTQDGDEGDDDPGEIRWKLTVDRRPLLSFIGNAPVPAGGQRTLDEAFDVGPVSTTDAVYEDFSIIGYIQEWDDSTRDCAINLPGVALPDGETVATMAGTSLKPGVQTWSIHRKVRCTSGQDFDITLHVAVRAL